MYRHFQAPRDNYGSRCLPDPRMLDSRTLPTDPYSRDRYLPKPQMPNGPIVSTDPASYSYSTANSNSWREQRSFQESLPYEGEYGLQFPNPLTLPPMDGSRQSRSLGDRDTARSVQDTHHFNRPEERASERHAPTAYGFRETRRSEGRGSRKSGEGVISRTHESHASTLNTIERQPRRSQGYAEERQSRRYHFYSEEEDNDIIKYIKAGHRWRQIGQKLGTDKRSISAHWYNGLSKDPRAKGVEYKHGYGK